MLPRQGRRDDEDNDNVRPLLLQRSASSRDEGQGVSEATFSLATVAKVGDLLLYAQPSVRPLYTDHPSVPDSRCSDLT